MVHYLLAFWYRDRDDAVIKGASASKDPQLKRQTVGVFHLPDSWTPEEGTDDTTNNQVDSRNRTYCTLQADDLL